MNKELSRIQDRINEFKVRDYYLDCGAIITPSGSVFDTRDLYGDGCPLCAQYLRDSEDSETICCHSDYDELEIVEAKGLWGLIQEKNRLEIIKYLGL